MCMYACAYVLWCVCVCVETVICVCINTFYFQVKFSRWRCAWSIPSRASAIWLVTSSRSLPRRVSPHHVSFVWVNVTQLCAYACVRCGARRHVEMTRADIVFIFPGNNLYNILPDVISHLSTSAELSSESFKSIMKCLLGFIEKDRQTEALVEKLCHRFKGATVVIQATAGGSSKPAPPPAEAAAAAPAVPKEVQAMTELQHARDLAFCLTVLNYNDRVVKKLLELFKLYADKLSDEEVFAHFQTVLGKARKFAKPEFRALIDELGAKLQAAHDNGPVREDGAPPPPPVAKAKKPAAKAAAKVRTRAHGRITVMCYIHFSFF